MGYTPNIKLGDSSYKALSKMLAPEQVFLQKGSCDGMGTADEPACRGAGWSGPYICP